MLAASLFGPEQYASTWLSMVMLLNAVAFGFVTGWGRSRERVAIGWWWVAFLLLLGPIALGRIDSVSVPIVMVGVTLLATRPGVAGILLTIATWIKVWPAAIVAAAVIALKQRRRVLAAALVLSAAILITTVAFGSGANVLSFITQQTGRGLQPEAPIGTPFMWQALAGVPGAFVYYDQAILSYGVTGPGADVAIVLMTPVLVLAVLAIAVLGIRAARAGASAADLLPPLALALTVALIAFNKVGSPQFIAWLAVPIVFGLAANLAGSGLSFRTPATLGLVVAGLTQLIYPYLYFALLSLDPILVSALTVRNLLEFVLLGWAVRAVVLAPRAARVTDDEEWLPSVWPLATLTKE
jgi:hypothetical protein